MKPTAIPRLPCAVFGHNYVYSDSSRDLKSTLSCKNCGNPLITNNHGDFIEESIPNKAIQSTLRQLFHFHLKVSKHIS